MTGARRQFSQDKIIDGMSFSPNSSAKRKGKYIELNSQPKQEGKPSVPLIPIDFHTVMEQVKSNIKSNSDYNAITVFKNSDIRILMMMLHKGTETVQHITDGLISVQVLEGQMQLITNDQTAVLSQGQMLTIPSGVAYNLLADTKTTVLLTLTTLGSKLMRVLKAKLMQ